MLPRTSPDDKTVDNNDSLSLPLNVLIFLFILCCQGPYLTQPSQHSWIGTEFPCMDPQSDFEMNPTWSTTYKEVMEEEPPPSTHSPVGQGKLITATVSPVLPLLREAQTQTRSPSSSPLSSIGNIWARGSGVEWGGLAAHISKHCVGRWRSSSHATQRATSAQLPGSNSVRSDNLQKKRDESLPEPYRIIPENLPTNRTFLK